MPANKAGFKAPDFDIIVGQQSTGVVIYIKIS
jgi:hypothetical protein